VLEGVRGVVGVVSGGCLVPVWWLKGGWNGAATAAGRGV